MFVRILGSLALVVSLQSEAHAQEGCKDILASGTMSKISYKNNSYAQLVLAARLTTMNKAQADKETEGSANFLAGKMPVGAEFNERQFSEWQESVSKSIDVNQILKNETDILISSGDKEIVAAWSSCMSSRGGVSAHFEELDKENVVLVLRYYPFPGGRGDARLQSKVFVSGGKIVDGIEFTAKGTRLSGGIVRSVSIKRNKNDPLLAVVNTEIGSSRAYLPLLVPVPSPEWTYRTKQEQVISGYAKTYRGTNLSSAMNQPIVIALKPDEEPQDTSDVLSNLKVVDGRFYNLGGSGLGGPNDFGFKLQNARWDAATRTITVDWSTGWSNGGQRISEFNMYITVQTAYRIRRKQ